MPSRVRLAPRRAAGSRPTSSTRTRRLGVRAERVVAHGPAPRGFLVHGGEAMLWTAYRTGALSREARTSCAQSELAERAGVDPSPLERSQPRDRRADLLRDFFGFCRFELVGEGGAEARAYLESRGFPEEAIADSGLGVVPAPAKTRSPRAGRLPSRGDRQGGRPRRLPLAGQTLRRLARRLWQDRHLLGAVA